MAAPATYDVLDGIGTITLDDGKVNVMSPAMQDAIHVALDEAQRDGGPVVLLGREGVLSAGFDLAVLAGGGTDAVEMVKGGFELAARVLAHPHPVIIGCTGHAIAMGSFLLLAGDHRVGVAGPYRLVANEVAIGLTMPFAAIEVLRQRLTPAAFNRAALLSEAFDPDGAVAAGFLDQVVAPGELRATVRSLATAAQALDAAAHAGTKARIRGPVLDAMRAAIDADVAAHLEHMPG
jgi:enoyl-CoA hydratase